MKTTAFVLSAFFSLSTLGSNLQNLEVKHYNDIRYVGCKIEGSKDALEVIFKLNKNKIVSYRTIYDLFKTEIKLNRSELNATELWVQYDSAYDTNYGVFIDQKRELTAAGSVSAWTSGNDSDNYQAEFNDNLVNCFDI